MLKTNFDVSYHSYAFETHCTLSLEVRIGNPMLVYRTSPKRWIHHAATFVPFAMSSCMFMTCYSYHQDSLRVCFETLFSSPSRRVIWFLLTWPYPTTLTCFQVEFQLRCAAIFISWYTIGSLAWYIRKITEYKFASPLQDLLPLFRLWQTWRWRQRSPPFSDIEFFQRLFLWSSPTLLCLSPW
jgi:hypothetical protein